ncbi:hypothetical protein H5410_061833 [Solanum commersonii]|uniref:Uncharacterized protein n=1 Tax=Solanum commersonii TaxID=4109 RepID=A0A9J5W8T0_SOLCO|nr:hypothetical protein H5410_061833 [Solanum commersonii]
MAQQLVHASSAIPRYNPHSISQQFCIARVMVPSKQWILRLLHLLIKLRNTLKKLKKCCILFFKKKITLGATGKRLEQRHGSLSSSLGVSKYDVGALNKTTLYANQKMQTPSKRTRLNSTTSSSQEMQTVDRLVLQKEDMQTNEHCLHLLIKKEKRVRGRNKCKEVASLENGQKLNVTFYNNRTVGTNINLFLRHLGKIIRDCNIFPLGYHLGMILSKKN